MSLVGKRKARVISTLDDEEARQGPSMTLTGIEGPKRDQPTEVHAPIKFTRKPAKSSSLRKSINFNDDDLSGDTSVSSPAAAVAAVGGGDEHSGVPVVIRPAAGRSGSLKHKKKPLKASSSSSGLSFGPGDLAASDVGDGEYSALTTPSGTPKKLLSHQAAENNALRRSASLRDLPTVTRLLGGDDDRPRYSKEYLSELQSSTPSTPQNLSSLHSLDDDLDKDPMDLDPVELEGATIVRYEGNGPVALTRPATPMVTVLTEAQIREKKERRQRLAQESEFISLESGDDEVGYGNGLRHINNQNKKKSESRLVAEDEDLGEGYDEFVEDGRLALGRSAERESRRQHKQEIAEMIRAAQEGSDVEDDDSEAERIAEYEAKQRRAGMDGLRRRDDDDVVQGANFIPKMRPLPELKDCLQRMRDLVKGLEDEVERKRERIKELEREKEEIAAREKEVEDILGQTGEKYKALMGPNVLRLETQSPLRTLLPPGVLGDLPVERGLESFGTTPVAARHGGDEVDEDSEVV